MERFIKHDLRLHADTLGKPLEGKWFDCRAVYTHDAKYRVIWEVHDDEAGLDPVRQLPRLPPERRPHVIRRQRLLEWPYWPQIIGGFWSWCNALGIYRRRANSQRRT